ncbi:MAG: iron-sulfur cluster assembly scaffold protein [Woeseiaceae bacterium]
MSVGTFVADPYNARVRELFADTSHAGTIAGAIGVANVDQGVCVEMSACLTAGRIETLRYRVRGCPHSIAACEAIAREFTGSDVSELEKFSVAELMQSLAVPAAKSGRILALEDTVRQLGTALRAAQSPVESD